MTITQNTVNGKRFESFESIPTSEETTARQLLAHDEAVDRVDLFTHFMEVWFMSEQSEWAPPAGWQIDSVSNFESGAMCITIVEADR